MTSASLVDLRRFLEVYQPLQPVVGEIAQFRVVLDANIAIADLLFKYKNPEVKQTAIEECIKSSAMPVYAPLWLNQEMIESAIPKVATRKSIAGSVLQELWLGYKEQIIWDDSFSTPQASAKSGVDVKDTPYVDLALHISALGVLSRDKDIERLGGTRLEMNFVLAVRKYARATSYHATIKVGGVTTGAVAIGGVSISGSKLTERIKHKIFKNLHYGMRQT